MNVHLWSPLSTAHSNDDDKKEGLIDINYQVLKATMEREFFLSHGYPLCDNVNKHFSYLVA